MSGFRSRCLRAGVPVRDRRFRVRPKGSASRHPGVRSRRGARSPTRNAVATLMTLGLHRLRRAARRARRCRGREHCEWVHASLQPLALRNWPDGDRNEERIWNGQGDRPLGVFATIQKTGSVLALPNADAPSRAHPALPGGAEAHNAEVRSYFVRAACPPLTSTRWRSTRRPARAARERRHRSGPSQRTRRSSAGSTKRSPS